MQSLKAIGEWDFSDERYEELDQTTAVNTSLRLLWRQYDDGM